MKISRVLLSKTMALIFLASLSLVSFSTNALAQAYDYYDYYDCYGVGFNDDDISDDDWFYDYYDYGDCDYVYTDYYDYGYSEDLDVFDWEEDGLF